MPNVLIVDDDPQLRRSLEVALRLEGYGVRTAADGDNALRAVEGSRVDLIVLDLQLPDRDGMDVLRELRRRGHRTPVMVLTGHGTIERAVEAVRLGAFDFLEKPPHTEKILLATRNALRQRELEEENRELREALEEDHRLIGGSTAMVRLREQIARVAPADAGVLVLGETGTGKELVARAIHRGSRRAAGPFVRVNCAAVPRELFEAELFGYERGAFTGAAGRRKGKFRRAQGGTLFLDEVGEIPLELQAKLLRAIETGEIEPLGADREEQVDVRIVAATNRDLGAMVARGAFRADLYHRLRVVELVVPPLRERLEDVEALAEHFLKQLCAKHNVRPLEWSPGALEALRAHPWPGNVRELKHVIERLVIFACGRVISAEDVREALPRRAHREAEAAAPRTLREIVEDAERRALEEALQRHGWNVSAAARELGLERSHLHRKLRALGLERPGT